MKSNFDRPVKITYGNGYPTKEQKEMFTDRFVLAFGYIRKDKIQENTPQPEMMKRSKTRPARQEKAVSV